MPRDLIDKLLVWAIDHPHAILIDIDTGEVHSKRVLTPTFQSLPCAAISRLIEIGMEFRDGDYG